MRSIFLALLILVAIAGCSSEQSLVYQCFDGKVVDSSDLCSEVKGCMECSGCENCEKCSECTKLNTENAQLFINTHAVRSNEGTYAFYYDIYNVGAKSSKNVLVKCNLYDKDKAIKANGKKTSASVQANALLSEDISISMSGGSNYLETDIPFCFIESCEDCTILSNNIPGFKDIKGIN